MTQYRESQRYGATETRRQLGISPAELRIMLAIVSHEAVFGESPTRAGVAILLGIDPNGYQLIRNGWIHSRCLERLPGGLRLAIWESTEFAKRTLGFDLADERRSA